MGLLLAVSLFLAASGDPYILREGTSTVLNTAQNTELQTLLAARFAGLTYASVYRVDCQAADEDRPWRCSVDSWATPTWAAIRESLLEQKTWVPGQGGAHNTWLVRTEKSFVASAAWRPLAQSIWADLLASPMLQLVYQRQNGTGSFVGTLSYKRSMNQTAIANAVNAGETLVPAGVTP